MTLAVPAPTGQAPPPGAPAPVAVGRETPPPLVQESIKYRRRAQEAERRAEALEAEIEALRTGRDDRTAALEADLARARSEADALRGRLDGLDRNRRLERALVQAGCADPEVGLALARSRLADAPPPDDLAAFARSLVEEKPALRSAAGAAPAGTTPAAVTSPPCEPGAGAPPDPPLTWGASKGAAVLPPPSASPHRTDPSARRAVERLAEQARRSGAPDDVMAYLRARRGRGA